METKFMKKEWLGKFNSIRKLHQLPYAYCLEIARSHLIHGEMHWYKINNQEITTWDNSNKILRKLHAFKNTL